MPVTARLSKAFYDQFGEQVTNELVEWFNLVDASYKADLKELNELNFARFDAKMEQRFAQFEAKVEQRFAQSEAKVEQRFAQSEAKVEQRFTQVEARVELRFAQVEAKMERRFSEQSRWMFLCWATLLASNIALWAR